MKKILLSLTIGFMGLAMSANSQTIYTENFSTAVFPAMPTGWTNNVTGGGGGWKTTNAAVSMVLSTVPSAAPDADFAYINDFNETSGSYDAPAYMQLTSSFSLVGSTNPWLMFDEFFDSSYDYRGTATDTFEYAWVDASTNGTTWTNIANLRAFGQWNTQFVNLSAYIGSATVYIRFGYTDGRCPNNGVAVGNISVFNARPNDISLVSVSPISQDPSTGYVLAGGSVPFTGVMLNLSPATISTFSATYQVGAAAPVTTTFSGSVPPMSYASFTCTPYTASSTIAQYCYTMTVNETGDPVLTNNSMGSCYQTVTSFPTKHIMYEEPTGSWCGYCVRGIVYLDSMWSIDAGHVSIVAVHNYNSYDPMAHENTQTTDYDNWITTFPGFTGFPSIIVDRRYVSDPSNAFVYYNGMNQWFAYADIGISSFIAGGNIYTTARVTPAMDLSGDYRLEMVVTESDVYHATGGLTGGWSQHNYYAADVGATGILVSSQYNFPDSSSGYVTGDRPMYMHYQFVDRYTEPTLSSATANGIASSLPASMTAGTPYTYTFAAAPYMADWNLANLHVIVMLIDNNASSPTYGNVLNSNWLNNPLSIAKEVGIVENFKVYPNPTSDIANIEFNLAHNSNIQATIYDAIGNVVYSTPGELFEAGNQRMSISTSGFASGIYNVVLTTDNGTMSQRISVVK